ncbi:MAG: hypothetical protein Q4B99_05645 [Clostridia bacterium]|nr:hypothetical protein [Clostridia bacterium]
MQRTMQQGVVPKRPQNPVEPAGSEPSPALQLARRIRAEQGVGQLKRFLNAIEPFVAPAERQSIAESMGVRLENAQDEQAMPRQSPYRDGAAPSSAPYGSPAINAGGMDMFSLLQGIMGRQGGAPTQGSGGGMDPMLLAQLMNAMNKGRK